MFAPKVWSFDQVSLIGQKSSRSFRHPSIKFIDVSQLTLHEYPAGGGDPASWTKQVILN